MDDDPIERVITPRLRDLDGSKVMRVLPAVGCRAIGPFVFLDHAGPSEVPPGVGFDVRPHPHIGLSTVSYLLSGEVVHRDSLGSVATIVPGAIDVMNAGRGIVHSERATDRLRREGGTLHLLQFWIALPTANEDDAPSFAHHAPSALPERAFEGGRARGLLGRALGLASPATTPSQPVLVELWLDAGAVLDLPSEIEDAGVYVLDGEIDAEARTIAPRTLLVRRPGARLSLRATTRSHLFLFGGPRLEGQTSRDPRVLDWNFVATTRERIEDAKRRWRQHAFPLVPGDEVERVELPS